MDQRKTAKEETAQAPEKALTAQELEQVSGGGDGRDDAMTGEDRGPSGIQVL